MSQSLTMKLVLLNNIVVSNYDIKLKKNYNVVANDYNIVDVYADVTQTHYFGF